MSGTINSSTVVVVNQQARSINNISQLQITENTTIPLRGGGQDVPVHSNAYDVPNNNKLPVCSRNEYEGKKKFTIYEGLLASYGGDDSDPKDFNENECNPYITDRLSHQEDNEIGFKIILGHVDMGVDELGKGVKVYLDQLRTKAYNICTFASDDELVQMGVDVNKLREYEDEYKYDPTKTPNENQDD